MNGWLNIMFFTIIRAILLADGAYLRVDGKKTQLVQGQAWILRKGQEKQKISVHTQIEA